MDTPLNASTTDITKVESTWKRGQYVGAILGIVLFSATMYAAHLSIKTNKLMIKKLTAEGF